MTFIGAALAHVITWDYCAGFIICGLVGGAFRLVWQIAGVRRW